MDNASLPGFFEKLGNSWPADLEDVGDFCLRLLVLIIEQGSLIDELVSVVHLKKYHSLYSLFYRKNLQL